MCSISSEVDSSVIHTVVEVVVEVVLDVVIDVVMEVVVEAVLDVVMDVVMEVVVEVVLDVVVEVEVDPVPPQCTHAGGHGRLPQVSHPQRERPCGSVAPYNRPVSPPFSLMKLNGCVVLLTRQNTNLGAE